MNEKAHGYLSAAFKRINKDIDQLFGKNEEMEGWIFMSHKYSVNDLMNSREYDDIYSIVEKMASDVENWRVNNQMNHSTMRVYNVNRELLANRMKRLDDAIKNRKETLWDSIREFFNKLWNEIMKILPVILPKLLKYFDGKTGFLGGVGEKLLALNNKMDKALISEKNKFISEDD
ncbi:MAG: hypothetical protein LBT51_06155 [Fusobacteriaceae bacterium]|jgi:hypothetical protein|nr:hypothetical protein [Fusobacteriaceae bacterium]